MQRLTRTAFLSKQSEAVEIYPSLQCYLTHRTQPITAISEILLRDNLQNASHG